MLLHYLIYNISLYPQVLFKEKKIHLKRGENPFKNNTQTKKMRRWDDYVSFNEMKILRSK